MPDANNFYYVKRKNPYFRGCLRPKTSYISHVLFLRATFGCSPRTPAAVIYLQSNCSALSFRSIPSERRPYQYLGFSLEGFTSFHPVCFQTGSVTVALFRVMKPYSNEHRFFPRRQFSKYQTALTYGFVRHEHYSHRRLCEHGLSSVRHVQRLLECFQLFSAKCYYSLF